MARRRPQAAQSLIALRRRPSRPHASSSPSLRIARRGRARAQPTAAASAPTALRDQPYQLDRPQRGIGLAPLAHERDISSVSLGARRGGISPVNPPVSTPPGPHRTTAARNRTPRPSGSHRVALDARAAHHLVLDLRQIARIEEVRSSEPARSATASGLVSGSARPGAPPPFGSSSLRAIDLLRNRSRSLGRTYRTNRWHNERQSRSQPHPGIDLDCASRPKRCRIVRRAPGRDLRPHAMQAHAMRTSVLPVVSPDSMRTSASGARSKPSTMVSR